MWLKGKFQWGLVVQTLNRNGRIYGIDFNRKEKKNPVNTDVTCENFKCYTSNTPKFIIYVYIKCVCVAAEGRVSFQLVSESKWKRAVAMTMLYGLNFVILRNAQRTT
jgi:hypothetical protein